MARLPGSFKHGKDDFELGAILGEGAYARVCVGKVVNPKSPVHGQEYAVKVMEKKFMMKHDKVKYVMLEKKVFVLCDPNPFICKMHFSFQDPYSLYFVLDYAKNGDLSYLIWKYMRLPVELGRFYLTEIVSAVQFMHSSGIFHRDLKPDNVLLHSDGHIRLTDFGTAKYVDPSDEEAVRQAAEQQRIGTGAEASKPDVSKVAESTSIEEFAERQMSEDPTSRRGSFVGTAFYVPPELLANGPFSFAGMDFWAMGIILYECLTGTVPFPGTMDYEVFKKIESMEYTIPADMDAGASSLIKAFLNPDFNSRLGSGGFEEIQSHEFFGSVESWDSGDLASATPPEMPPVPPESPWVAQGGDSAATSRDHRSSTEMLMSGELSELEKAHSVDVKSTSIEELTSQISGIGSSADSSSAAGKKGHHKQQSSRSFDSGAFSRWTKLLKDGENIVFGGQIEVSKMWGLSSDSFVMLLTDTDRLLMCDHIKMSVVHVLLKGGISSFSVTDKDWFQFKNNKKTWKIKGIGAGSAKWKKALGM